MHAMQDEAGASLTAAHDTPSSPAPVPTGGRRRLYVVLLGLAALVLVLDQATKVWALAALTPGEAVELVGSMIKLNLIRNPGAAFSIGNGSTWVLTAVSLGILVWVVVGARKVGNMPWAVALGLLLGGAVGNLIDRAAEGAVTDFVDVSIWPAFNLADTAITIGVLSLLYVLEGPPSRADRRPE